MKATILPLANKYYGTIIQLQEDDAVAEIKVWTHLMNSTKPSRRQMKSWGVKTLKEAQEQDFLCDTHYETDFDYKLAKAMLQGIINQILW